MSTFRYFGALETYLRNHGRPVAFYSDKHTVFRVAQQAAKSGHGMTQFGRALNELNLEILCASSSQAKGRVERANRTPGPASEGTSPGGHRRHGGRERLSSGFP